MRADMNLLDFLSVMAPIGGVLAFVLKEKGEERTTRIAWLRADVLAGNWRRRDFEGRHYAISGSRVIYDPLGETCDPETVPERLRAKVLAHDREMDARWAPTARKFADEENRRLASEEAERQRERAELEIQWAREQAKRDAAQRDKEDRIAARDRDPVGHFYKWLRGDA
jgi:hypothetical protein